MNEGDPFFFGETRRRRRRRRRKRKLTFLKQNKGKSGSINNTHVDEGLCTSKLIDAGPTRSAKLMDIVALRHEHYRRKARGALKNGTATPISAEVHLQSPVHMASPR